VLQHVLDWFAKLLNLPTAYLATQPDGSKGLGGGVIQGTASEACLVAVLASKSRKMKGRPLEDSLKLVAYSSDQAHSCVKKACMVAGIHYCRLLPATSERLPDLLLDAYLLGKCLGFEKSYIIIEV
jgi:aromatic-L-amino-acid decarboxylase